MAYAIGYMLPIILVVGGIVWFLMALAEDSSNKRDIQRMIDENSKVTKDYFNKKYGEGTIK